MYIVTMKADWVCRSRAAWLAGFISIGLICLEAAPTFSQETSAAKTPAPNWKLTDLNGKPVNFSDFRGQVLILDFWAT